MNNNSNSGPKPERRTIHSQPSFILATPHVELAVTLTGGHMAPVTFFRDTVQPIQPYHIAPWQDEPPTPMPAPLLAVLRGDFLCMPFGFNAEEVNGERHPVHGEVAGSPWTFVSQHKTGDVTTLTLGIDTKMRRGRVTKELSLIDGQNVIYSTHTIEGFSGPVPLGHHATLAMPEKEGAVRIATSRIRFGMTAVGLFSDPLNRAYQALLPGQKWTDLTKVPRAWKGAPDADLTRLPMPRGFADLVQIYQESWETTNGPAWVAATFADQGFVWFALKDPAVLHSTLFWMENHGLHGHPWNGRNNCLGIEDMTGHFADGLAASTKENVLTKQGVETALTLTADKPTSVTYIQGVVKVPAGFENVSALEFAPGQVTFVSTGGLRVTAPVRHEFLRSGRL